MPEPRGQDRFLALLDENRRILFKVANAYGASAADRDDLVQEMAIQLWRSFARYDDRYRFSTWMYRVALNVAISFHRKESRRSRGRVEDDAPVLEAAPAPAPDRTEDDLAELRRAIDGLDPMDRALVLLYLDGNRHETIAEILGLSASNVGTKLNRIKNRLRRDVAASA